MISSRIVLAHTLEIAEQVNGGFYYVVQTAGPYDAFIRAEILEPDKSGTVHWPQSCPKNWELA